MGTYTYKQFEDAAKNAGLYGEFSTADLSLAQRDPDAGMSILKYKQDYHNAASDEARALANLGAEGIRASYGNYSGGGDGGSFALTGLSPNSFSYESAPTYESRYDETIQTLLDKLLNREAFSYDPSTDKLYSQYRKQYAREGQRAAQDALGAAASTTGGIPSSYATTAATQASDYYASQLTDKLPELYELAYNKYLSDYNMQLNDLGAVQDAEAADYSKYLDTLSQWNTDRSFAYNKLLDEIESQASERSEAMSKAQTAADYGDYSFLQKLGINTDNNPTDWERQYQLAVLAAQYGDESGLRALGIAPRAASSASAKSSGGGTSTTSTASDEGMKLSVAKEYAKQGIFNEAVIAALKEGGYNDEYLKTVYGYEPESAPYSTEPSYQTAYFSAAMRGLSMLLAQGKAEEVASGIESFWDKLSTEQKKQVQALLDQYGFNYEEG